MADDIDKFVLQYSVELKDAINRLEQLNQKVEEVNKKPGRAKQAFSEFSRDAGNEIGRLIPGIEKVGQATSAMTVGFSTATAAVAALAAGIASVIKLREQFNQQRMTAMDAGLSTLRLEDIERKFARTSGGTISREQTRENVKGVSDFVRRAYTDPTRSGPENRLMRMMGMNPGVLGGEMLSTKDALGQLATKFQQIGPERAQGIAGQVGISKDFAITMAKLGPEINRVTDLTAEEINKRKEAEAELAKFNDEMAKFNEHINKLQISLGSNLLPVINKVIDKVKALAEIADRLIPDADKVAEKGTPEHELLSNPWRYGFPGIAMGKYAYEKASSGVGFLKGLITQPDGQEEEKGGRPRQGLSLLSYGQDKQQRDHKGALPNNWNVWPNNADRKEAGTGENGTLRQEEKRTQATPAGGVTVEGQLDKVVRAVESQTVAAEKGSESIDEIVDQADRNNEMGLQTASQMSLAVNMFNAAVHTFSNAIDERQAWAAWAGMVGAASGLNGATAGPNKASEYPAKQNGTPDWGAMSSTGNYDPISGTVPGGVVASPVSEAQPVVAKASGKSAAPSEYDKYFEEAERLYGIPAHALKAQAVVESNLNPKAESKAGAMGIMQLMPETAKSLGVGDPYDPRSNILGGAKLMRENLERAQSYEEALMMYHGGLNKANYGPLTRSYPDKVKREIAAASAMKSGEKIEAPEAAKTARDVGLRLEYKSDERHDRDAPDQTNAGRPASLNGQDWAKSPNVEVPKMAKADDRYFDPARANAAGGENREKINLKATQQNIAQSLGVPVEQLQHGGINRDDVAWRVAQLEAGYQNRKTQIQTELANPMLTDSQRADLLEQYKTQETGLQALRAYGPQVISEQREGKREITIGERAIQINVNGAGEPQETAEAVKERLDDSIDSIVNNASDGVKY